MIQLRLFDVEFFVDDDAAVDELLDRLRSRHDDEPEPNITDVPTGGLL